ncbi:signal peptide plus transmembrane domain or GPI anchor [Cryptosporidium sp. chipmunk genotype I]|uniref:signal peptide plus transmembrane domain or GPI anchor n=1 Tax=Cryptosporidium sp. chipmunk genotype I TaxID=1280935 RepID=UPI00351A03E4|nr:signal peptide plus transmembrane domain or GPI anchor [Cryptosporidium sp. chipmunk genotype I]
MRVGKIGEAMLLLVLTWCFLIFSLDLSFINGDNYGSGIRFVKCDSKFENNKSEGEDSESLELGLELLKDTIGKTKNNSGNEIGKSSNNEQSKMEELSVKSTLTESEIVEESEKSTNSGLGEEDFEKDDSTVSDESSDKHGFLSQSLGPSFGRDECNNNSEIDSATADKVIKNKMKSIKEFDDFSKETEEDNDDDDLEIQKIKLNQQKMNVTKNNSIQKVANNYPKLIFNNLNEPNLGLNNTVKTNTNVKNKDNLPTFYYPGGTGISQPDVYNIPLGGNSALSVNQNVINPRPIMKMNNIQQSAGVINRNTGIVNQGLLLTNQNNLQIAPNPQPKPAVLHTVPKPQSNLILLQNVNKPQPKPTVLRTVPKPQPNLIVLQNVNKPKPKQIVLHTVSKPQPKPAVLHTVPKPQSNLILLQNVNKPKPKPIVLHTVSKPQPKPAVLHTVPKPQSNLIVLQNVKKTQPKPAVLHKAPKPQSNLILLQNVNKPQPKPIVLHTVSKPQPKPAVLHTVPKPQSNLILLQNVNKPQPKPTVLRTVPKPQPNLIVLQNVNKPKPKPKPIVLHTVSKPQPKPAVLHTVPKPQSNLIVLQNVKKKQPKQETIVLKKVGIKPSGPSRSIIRPAISRSINLNKRPRLIPFIVGNTKPTIRKYIQINDKDDNTSNMEVKIPYKASNIKALRRNEPFLLINDPSLRYGPNVKRRVLGKRLIPVYVNDGISNKGSIKLPESDILLKKELKTLKGNEEIEIDESETEESDDNEHNDDDYIKLIRVNKNSMRNNNRGNVKYIHKDIVLKPKYIDANQLQNGRASPRMQGQYFPHANNNANMANQKPKYGIPMFPVAPNTGELQSGQKMINHGIQENSGDMGHFPSNSINEYKDSRPWYLQSTFIFSFIGIIFLLIAGAIAIYYIAA